jgi:diphthine synthase
VIGGMGVGGPKNLTCGLLEAVRACDYVFAEKYTDPEDESTLQEVESFTGKKVVLLDRADLEENNALVVLKAAQQANVALLVFGDPFIFTTHLVVKRRAESMGIPVKVFHGLSVLSLAPSSSGLDPYRFGPPVTLVFPDEKYGYFPETPYEVVADNLSRDLHTLLLMDVRASEGRFMSFEEAFDLLGQLEKKLGKGIFVKGRKIVLLAALGSDREVVKWVDFGDGPPRGGFPLPRSAIIPASIRFYEEASPLGRNG